MTIATGVNKQVKYKVESAWGTVPAAASSQLLRRITSDIDLTKDAYESNEIRTDYQVADMRHGSLSVGGTINGELSPGTYKDFMGLAMKDREYGSNSQKMAGNEQIASEVGANPNGIGYLGFAYAHAKGTKIVSIEGALPSTAEVKKYPYARPTFLYTSGLPTGTTKQFIDFCFTASGEAIVTKVGFVPKSRAK